MADELTLYKGAAYVVTHAVDPDQIAVFKANTYAVVAPTEPDMVGIFKANTYVVGAPTEPDTMAVLKANLYVVIEPKWGTEALVNRNAGDGTVGWTNDGSAQFIAVGSPYEGLTGTGANLWVVDPTVPGDAATLEQTVTLAALIDETENPILTETLVDDGEVGITVSVQQGQWGETDEGRLAVTFRDGDDNPLGTLASDWQSLPPGLLQRVEVKGKAPPSTRGITVALESRGGTADAPQVAFDDLDFELRPATEEDQLPASPAPPDGGARHNTTMGMRIGVGF